MNDVLCYIDVFFGFTFNAILIITRLMLACHILWSTSPILAYIYHIDLQLICGYVAVYVADACLVLLLMPVMLPVACVNELAIRWKCFSCRSE